MMKSTEETRIDDVRQALLAVHTVMKKGGLLYSLSLNNRSLISPVYLDFVQSEKLFKLEFENRSTFKLPGREGLHNIYLYILRRL